MFKRRVIILVLFTKSLAKRHRLFTIFLLSFAFLNANLLANPAPFGLIINKTTVQELKDKYAVTPLGINKNNGLEAFEINPQSIDFAGLLSARAVFSPDGILKIVQLSLPSNKFTDIYQSLSKKYKLAFKNIVPNGNKEAKFQQDNTYILLYTLASAQKMDFLYINKQLLEEALQSPIKHQALNREKEVNRL